MKIISVRENPEYAERIITYLQQCWSEMSPVIYSDCVNHTINAINPLPQWYVLEKDNEFIGYEDLVTKSNIHQIVSVAEKIN